MRLNLRHPHTQKWFIGMALAFTMLYGYIQFVYLPRKDAGRRLSEDVKTETEMLAKGKRIAANFQTVQDDYSRLVDSWNIAQQLLPTSKEMEELLKQVAQEGQQHNVDFLLFKPMEPVEQPYYWENPIQVKTLSSYHNLGQFLSAVASLDRIVNITNFKISAYHPNRGRSPNTVEADFVATVYIFKELGAPTTVASTNDKDVKGKPRPKNDAKSPGNKPKKGDA
jgi:type IV pilus assembly protein PilO